MQAVFLPFSLFEAIGIIVCRIVNYKKGIVVFGASAEAMRDILEALEAGHMLDTACAISGVHYETTLRWLGKGARDLHEGRESDFAAFTARAKRAMGSSVAELWSVVLEAARKGDVKAAQWALSKHSPSRFGDKLAIEQSVVDKPEVPANEEEARARWEAIGRRNGWLT